MSASASDAVKRGLHTYKFIQDLLSIKYHNLSRSSRLSDLKRINLTTGAWHKHKNLGTI